MEPLNTLTNTVPWMDKAHQAVIRAGLGLFELRLPFKSIRDRQVYGPFDVEVNEETDRSLRSRFRAKWFTGVDAYVSFRVDDDGNGLAWLVDDMWWHNRIYLMDSPHLLNVVNLHTKNGFIPSSVVLAEIAALRRALKEERPMFEIFKEGKREGWDWAWTREEAEAKIKKEQYVTPQFDQATGKLVAIPGNVTAFEIRSGSRLEYKPKIAELIMRYRQMEFGWTSCQEFQEMVKAPVIEEMKKIRTALNGQQQGGISPEMLASLRESIKADIMNEIAKAGDARVSGEAQTAAAAGSVPETTKTNAPAANIYKRWELQKMTAPALVNLLASKQIVATDMNKADMIEAVMGCNPKNEEEVS